MRTIPAETLLFLPPNRPAHRAAALERKSYPEALGVAAASRSERADGVLYPSFSEAANFDKEKLERAI